MRKVLIALLTVGVVALLLVDPGPDRPMHEKAPAPLVLGPDPDRGLQFELNQVVRGLGLGNAVDEGKLALLLVVITDPERPRLAELNGHRMIYAASLPKIAILLGAAVAVQEGRVQLDPDLRADMVSMIRYSCNDCATRVLERVGRDYLIELLQSPHYRFYDPRNGGGLWVGKDYAPTPAYQRDPINQISHGASAFQVARLYYMLETGTLVGPESTALMHEALSRPGLRHKFVHALGGIPGLEMMRKSGTWRQFHSDSALVRYRGESYIIVGLAEDEQGGQWLASLARPLHRLAMAQSREARRQRGL